MNIEAKAMRRWDRREWTRDFSDVAFLLDMLLVHKSEVITVRSVIANLHCKNEFNEQNVRGTQPVIESAILLKSMRMGLMNPSSHIFHTYDSAM